MSPAKLLPRTTTFGLVPVTTQSVAPPPRQVGDLTFLTTLTPQLCQHRFFEDSKLCERGPNLVPPVKEPGHLELRSPLQAVVRHRS